MEFSLLAIAAVVILVSASILSSKISVATPLILVLIGIGIGYLPFVPLIELDPSFILMIVLPPLLYAAAVNVPVIDFKRNFQPVVGLSVLLVIISATVIGFAVHWLVPEVPLAAAIALGAVISPTDAVAATSIGKRLGMPDRTVLILEGESLVNDATSLVLLKTAIASISGSFLFSTTLGTFFLSVAVAVIVGYLVGFVTVRIRSRLSNPVHDTVVSFVVPFVAFIPAEQLHGSGVLAVVVTGLYTGSHAVKKFSATARINERLNWLTIQFFLENGVFFLMGLQLHSLVNEVVGSSFHISHIGWLTIALVVLLIIVRSVFMAPLILVSRRASDRYRQNQNSYESLARHSKPRKLLFKKSHSKQDLLNRDDIRYRRTVADLEHQIEHRLSWRDGAALSWAGMRGVVTLAAAQSFPLDVPYRAQLVLVAFSVALLTLMLHGLTLPVLIAKLWPSNEGRGRHKEELRSLTHDLTEAANSAIDDAVQVLPEQVDKRLKESVLKARASVHSSLLPLAEASAETREITVVDLQQLEGETPFQTYQRLVRLALDAQRETLLQERAIGRYSSEVLRMVESALDTYEMRLNPPTSH